MCMCISVCVQPDKPLMVMEFWSGWFYHWGEESLRRNQDPNQLTETTAKILKAGASLNYYMFHGRSLSLSLSLFLSSSISLSLSLSLSLFHSPPLSPLSSLLIFI